MHAAVQLSGAFRPLKYLGVSGTVSIGAQGRNRTTGSFRRTAWSADLTTAG